MRDAGLLDALQNETPPSGPSPTGAELLGPVYQAPSEPSLLADGLIEPVSSQLFVLCLAQPAQQLMDSGSACGLGSCKSAAAVHLVPERDSRCRVAE